MFYILDLPFCALALLYYNLYLLNNLKCDTRGQGNCLSIKGPQWQCFQARHPFKVGAFVEQRSESCDLLSIKTQVIRWVHRDLNLIDVKNSYWKIIQNSNFGKTKHRDYCAL